MNIKKTILSLALIFVATLNVAAQSQTEQGKDLDSLYAQNLLKAGTVAPEFSLPMPNRKIFSLADHKGKYILLDFWASWCPDCRKDIPKVKEMYERYGKKVVFVGVSFDTDHNRWSDCIANTQMTWLHVSELKRMREAEISKTYGVQWIPSMTLIGPDGKVILSTVVIERMEKALSEIKD